MFIYRISSNPLLTNNENMTSQIVCLFCNCLVYVLVHSTSVVLYPNFTYFFGNENAYKILYHNIQNKILSLATFTGIYRTRPVSIYGTVFLVFSGTGSVFTTYFNFRHGKIERTKDFNFFTCNSVEEPISKNIKKLSKSPLFTKLLSHQKWAYL